MLCQNYIRNVFPAKYQDLQISDHPDLRTKDGNIGIEVTSAIPQEEQEALAPACEIPYIDKENQEKRIAYLEKKVMNTQSMECRIHPEVMGG